MENVAAVNEVIEMHQVAGRGEFAETRRRSDDAHPSNDDVATRRVAELFA
jgi:hypothetical protein